MKKIGIVKFFNKRGWGFVVDNDTNEEYFIHYSQILGDGYKMLFAGDKVEFEEERLDKGPRAINVVSLSQPANSF